MAAKQRLKRPRTTVSDGPDACLGNKNGSMMSHPLCGRG